MACAAVPLDVLHLREDEHVAAHHIAAVGAEYRAAIFLARRLTGAEELALGPVAHHLEAGFAGDHHRGRVVPVAAGHAGIHQAAQLLEHFGDMLKARARDRFLGVLAIDREIKVGAAFAGENSIKKQMILPGCPP